MIQYLQDALNQPKVSDYKTDFAKAKYLKEILINKATKDGYACNSDCQILRQHFIDRTDSSELIPDWVIKNESLDEFWEYIKVKYTRYDYRKRFIERELAPLLKHLKNKDIPLTKPIQLKLKSLDSAYVLGTWEKALRRKNTDPDGAITSARSLIETVLKHILDEMEVEYGKDCDLHELYKFTTNQLSLSPEQHSDKLIRQVLGG